MYYCASKEADWKSVFEIIAPNTDTEQNIEQHWRVESNQLLPWSGQ